MDKAELVVRQAAADKAALQDKAVLAERAELVVKAAANNARRTIRARDFWRGNRAAIS